VPRIARNSRIRTAWLPMRARPYPTIEGGRRLARSCLGCKHRTSLKTPMTPQPSATRSSHQVEHGTSPQRAAAIGQRSASATEQTDGSFHLGTVIAPPFRFGDVWLAPGVGDVTIASSLSAITRSPSTPPPLVSEAATIRSDPLSNSPL
jgi:hypothetical protein